MAYSNFTFAKLKRLYDIDQIEQKLFENIDIQEIEPSATLISLLEETKGTPLMTEKAKSENIIAPIMRELKRLNPNITVFSGYTFNIENEAELTGAPDFMISAKARIVEPQSPIFCMVESKNKTPDEGYAQCAAEMYAAYLFNNQMNEPHEVIYGAVTNAFDWVFMKFENKTIYIDLERYFINQLPKILGIMNFIIKKY
jgi:hypothetical protein